MAENVEITPGSGDTVAADEIGGVKHQRVKLQFGPDGEASDVAHTEALPTTRPKNLSVYEATLTSGNTAAITPGSGNAIRVHYVYAMSSPGAEAFPVIRVGFNDGAGGSTIDTDKGKYRVYGVAKERIFEGGADEKVIVSLSEAGSVAVTIHYEEFTPV